MPKASVKKNNKFWHIIGKGIIGSCPNCGNTKLFKSYLKQVTQCKKCKEEWGKIKADDGPAWLTIFLVGHIIAPILLVTIPGSIWPDWLLITFWTAVSIALALILLPRTKGLFIAILWYLKLPKKTA